MRVLLILYIFMSPTAVLLSQVKYEKEYRIHSRLVPESALAFLEQLPFQRSVKWYKEESLTATTYEAKTKENGQKYSIEFDSTGLIEDIEVKIKWISIRETVRASIDQSLRQDFEKYRLIKIQRQWTGSVEDLVEAVKSESAGTQIIVRYEMVIKGKSETGWQWYEVTFSDAGDLLSRKQIILRNTDNLEY